MERKRDKKKDNRQIYEKNMWIEIKVDRLIGICI